MAANASDANFVDRLFFRAFTGAAMLSPAYAGKGKLPREMFERYKAACVDVGDVPMDIGAFSAIFKNVEYTSDERATSETNMFGQLLARNKNHEYDPYVKQDDLEDLDDMPESTVWLGRRLIVAAPGFGHMVHSGQTEWARALQRQMREAFAYVNCNTFHLAAMVRRLVGEAVAKLGPDWKKELDRFSALADKMEEAPFAGLQWPLPTEQRITSWPRLALIGLEYRLTNITDAAERDRVFKYKDLVARKVKNASDVNVCKRLAETIPRGLMGKKALLEGASLTVAQWIMKGESEDSRREVLRLLTEADIKCEWRKNQEELADKNKRKGE
jgi:hypothetical protein